MKRFLLAIMTSALVLSGCVSDAPAAKEDGKVVSVQGRSLKAFEPGLERLIGHSAQGKLDPREIFEVLPNVSYVPVGVNGPEPSIGVTKNGMVFFQAIEGADGPTAGLVGPATLRSDDGGRTWKNIAQLPLTSPTTLDPFMWVDPDTDRVFVNHLYVACSYMSWSDDYGASWTTNPVACGFPANDHQKVATGKYRAPLTATPLYPNAVYYAWNQFGGNAATGVSRISTSLDGGITWISNKMIDGPTCAGGLHGRIKSGPDGYIYVPKRDCYNIIVGASADNGLTWSQVKVGLDAGSAQFRKNPDLAIDSENNVYAVWPGKDNRLYLSISKDHGKTWSAQSILASPPEVTTVTMPSMVAGSPGRIAFAYYGVYDGNGKSPECVGTDERWDVYVTFSLNALDPEPEFVTVRANDLQDPVQIGGISTNSGTPPAEENCKYRRNLLDFIDMVMDKEGRVYVATADGCIECEQQADSTGSMGVASVLQAGPSLLADKGWLTQPPVGVAK